MDRDRAEEIARPYSKNHTVIVDGNGSVYVDCTAKDCIENIESQNLDWFLIKGELPKKKSDKKITEQ